jgi:hypothetical protein
LTARSSNTFCFLLNNIGGDVTNYTIGAMFGAYTPELHSYWSTPSHGVNRIGQCPDLAEAIIKDPTRTTTTNLANGPSSLALLYAINTIDVDECVSLDQVNIDTDEFFDSYSRLHVARRCSNVTDDVDSSGGVLDPVDPENQSGDQLPLGFPYYYPGNSMPHFCGGTMPLYRKISIKLVSADFAKSVSLRNGMAQTTLKKPYLRAVTNLAEKQEKNDHFPTSAIVTVTVLAVLLLVSTFGNGVRWSRWVAAQQKESPKVAPYVISPDVGAFLEEKRQLMLAPR